MKEFFEITKKTACVFFPAGPLFASEDTVVIVGHSGSIRVDVGLMRHQGSHGKFNLFIVVFLAGNSGEKTSGRFCILAM